MKKKKNTILSFIHSKLRYIGLLIFLAQRALILPGKDKTILQLLKTLI
jgi:hypothetical protein